MDHFLSHTPLVSAVPRELLLMTADDLLAREVSYALKDMSYNVSRFRTPERALESILGESRFDLWLGDGPEALFASKGALLRQIRLSIDTLGIPALMIVDPHADRDWDMVDQLTASDFLLKPLDATELILRLQWVFQKEAHHAEFMADMAVSTGGQEFAKYVQRDLASRTSQNRSAILSLIEAFGANQAMAGGRVAEAKALTEAAYLFLAMNLRRVDRMVQFDQTRVAVYQPDRVLQTAEAAFALMRTEMEAQIGKSLSIGMAEFPQDGGSFEELLKWADTALSAARSRPGSIMARAWLSEGDEPAAVSRQVLLVEEDPDTVALIGMNMKTLGYELRVAPNQVDALRILDEQVPAMALVGRCQSQRSILEILKEFRSSRVGIGDPPIVILAGPADESDLLQSLEWGVVDFLRKPLNERELQFRITRVLSDR
ncbi:MAG: response regulator [Acidobacteria bacterium]|nr:response regulator [Acidobacteriota bacterium]